MRYQQLIENTIVPGTMSRDAKNELYKPIKESVNKILPSKLYRFRCCSERSISAFLNDELWFSNGSVMNDDFDARLYYDKKEIQNWLDDVVAEDGCLKAFDQIRNMTAMPAELISLVPNAEYALNVLKSMPKDQAEDISTQILSTINNTLDTYLKDITQRVQSQTKFACFSKKIDSDMMWGHYANNGTGFALEYKFGTDNTITYRSEVDSTSVIWANLFPIIYGKRRLNTTTYAIYLFQVTFLREMARNIGLTLSNNWIDAIVPCPDEFMATKLAMEKSSEWKPEMEWRMFYTTNNILLNDQQHSYVKQKPSAIYLGRKISKLNQKILVDIAKEKNIPVYKMDFNDNSKKYRLRKAKLHE